MCHLHLTTLPTVELAGCGHMVPMYLSAESPGATLSKNSCNTYRTLYRVRQHGDADSSIAQGGPFLIKLL